MTVPIQILLCAVAAAMACLAFWQWLQYRQLRKRFQPVVDVQAEKARVVEEIAQSRLEAERALSAIVATRKQEEQEEVQLRRRLAALAEELRPLEEEEILNSHGLYKPIYKFSSSEQFETRLELVRERQHALVKQKTAALCTEEWTVYGSKAEGRKMTDRMLRLMLRAFNGECDAATAKVNYKNIKTMEARITKAVEAINGLAEVQKCHIMNDYVELKLEELRLVHEYEEKLQEEREEQKRLREQMREEEAARREMEKAKLEAEREERRYAEALRKAQDEVGRAEGAKQQKLLVQIEELQARLAEAQAQKRAISQAQLTKAGHVYIISNHGSFGENVLKIGMTRRLVPQDRIDELGDASVPFEFDVHAIIRTQDAPALETALHRVFDRRRVNLINPRKEFFRVSLDEVAEVVREQHGEFELTKLAEGAEYRKTMALINDLQREAAPAAVG